MQLYPGTDPVTVLVALTPTANYGLWPTPDCITTDTLSAANLMTAVQSVTDRTNFIGWRLPNYIDGGTQDVLANVTFQNANHTSGPGIIFDCVVETLGVVSLQGVRNYLACATYVNNGATLHVGDTTYGVGHFVIDATGGGAGSDGQVKGGAQFTITGSSTALVVTTSAQLQVDDSASAAIVGDCSFGFTSTTSKMTRYNPEKPLGSRGYRELRRGKPSGWDSNVTFSPEAYDLIEVGLPTADRTWTLNAPPSGSATYTEVRIRPTTANAGAHKILINDHTSLQIGQIDFSQAGGPSHTLGSMLLGACDDGSGTKVWRVVAVSGDLCSDSILF